MKCTHTCEGGTDNAFMLHTEGCFLSPSQTHTHLYSICTQSPNLHNVLKAITIHHYLNEEEFGVGTTNYWTVFMAF